nr:MAG TPA: hypothetical protein [Caudoviricetes sp.]
MLLLAIYYSMLVLQLFGVIKFTNRKITVTRCLIPFYYWVTNPESYK